MLLEHGVNVNSWAGKFGSALIAATASGHKDIIEKLLERGADVKIWSVTFNADPILNALY